MTTKKSLGRQLKALNKEAGMEYKYTQDVSGAIFGNLGTSLKGTARSLTGIQAGQLAKLQALRVNSGAQQRRIVSGAGATIRNSYGTAIAGAVSPAQHALQVGAKAAKVSLGGTVKAGATFARGNDAAMSALQTAAGGAASAASYENAQAFAMRNQTNAATIAAQQLELEKMKYQNKLDLQNYEAKAKFDAAQAEKAGGGTTAQQLISNGSDLALSARTYWSEWYDGTEHDDQGRPVDADGNPLHLDISTMAQQFAQENGYLTGEGALDMSEPHVALFIATVRKLNQDPAHITANAYRSAVTDLYQDTKGWDKWGEHALNAGYNSVQAALTAQPPQSAQEAAQPLTAEQTSIAAGADGSVHRGTPGTEATINGVKGAYAPSGVWYPYTNQLKLTPGG